MRTPPPGAGRGDTSVRPRRQYVRRVVAPGLLAVSAVAVPVLAGAVTSQQVSVASIPGVGSVLVSGHRALYVHTGDTKRHSTCTGACAVAWPPLLVSSRSAHHLGHVHGLGTFRRANGRLQVTIKGEPLYFFVGDKTLTSASGQGFANVFWTVRSNGTVVHVKPAAAPVPASPAPPSTPSAPTTPSTPSTSSTPGTHTPGSQMPMEPAPANPPPTSPPPTSPPPTTPPTTTTTSPPPTTTTTTPSGGGVSF